MDKPKLGPLKTVYDGKIFQIKTRPVTYPDGQIDTFEYCERHASATVLAFDDNNRLLLTKEYRHNYGDYVWFLPTGAVDDGEEPLQAAKRELQEEVGYKANTMKLIKKVAPSSSYIIWDVYLYAAKDLELAPLDGDEKFPIEVVPTPLDQAAKMALDGDIKNEFLAFHIVQFDHMLKTGQFKW